MMAVGLPVGEPVGAAECKMTTLARPKALEETVAGIAAATSCEVR